MTDVVAGPRRRRPRPLRRRRRLRADRPHARARARAASCGSSSDDPALAADLQRWIERLAAKPGRRGPRRIPHASTPAASSARSRYGARTCSTTRSCRGSILVSRDVTEQRRTEADARLAARLLEASPVAVVATDAAGVITAWNPAAERTLGWTADEAIGRTFRDLGGHTADSLAVVYDHLPTLLPGRPSRSRPTSCAATARTFPAYFSAVGLLDADGAFAGFLNMGLDLSTEHEAREALARSEGRWSALAPRDLRPCRGRSPLRRRGHPHRLASRPDP